MLIFEAAYVEAAGIALNAYLSHDAPQNRLLSRW